MALVAIYGFDDSVAETGASAGGGTFPGRAGAGGASYAGLQTITLATPTAELFTGFAYQASANSTAVPPLKLLEGSVEHIRVVQNADLTLSIQRGTTAVATSAAGYDLASAWRYIEAHVRIADSGGIAEVRVDGAVAVTFSGDTRNAGTNGVCSAIIINNMNSTGIQCRLDDMYVLDATDGTATQGAPYNTYLGDIAVRTLLPSGNGDSSGFVGSDGNSVDNYALVDETNSSATDYVGSQTSGAIDLYQMSDLPTGYDVLALQELVYYAKTDAGTAPTLLPVAKGQAGTVRTDAALPVASATYVSQPAQLRFTDPDGNPLTAARVNAMQVGVKIQ